MDPTQLAPIGWRAYFQQQLSLEEFETLSAWRIAELHRTKAVALGESGREDIQFAHAERWSEHVAVGDWILARREGEQFYLTRVLDRENGLSRKAAGSAVNLQWLAANLNTIFIAMACDQLFSVSRVERYLSLVLNEDLTPVVVLTKADQVEDAPALAAQIDASIRTVTVDARVADQVAVLQSYLGAGQTVAVLGMSGAGKSTLINTLIGSEAQRVGDVREQDGRGRHTTTARQLLLLPSGALIIDTPGMRELQLPGGDEGIATIFEDVVALQQRCRFSDCQHAREPGCAIRAALESGALDERRWRSYQKLQREQAHAGRELSTHFEQQTVRKSWIRRARESQRAKKLLRQDPNSET